MSDLADRTDNVSLTKDDGTAPVDVINDGVYNRLAVNSNATIVGVTTLADQGKAWSGVVNGITISGTAEADYILIKNPSGSGKICRLIDLLYTTNADNSTIRFYRDPTITSNGTSISLVNFKKGAAASLFTAFFSPTISARGTLIYAEFVAGRKAQSFNSENVRSLIDGENFLMTTQTGSGKDHYMTMELGEV